MDHRKTKRLTGLRSEILLTLTILFGSALLLGGFLFLRYTEQNLLQQRIQMATLGLRLTAYSLSAKNLKSDSLKTELTLKFQNELNAQNGWLFDQNLDLQFSYHSPEKFEVPLTKLRQVLLTGNEVVELTWPGLLSFFTTDQDFSLFVAVPLKTTGRPQGVLATRFSLQDILLKLNAAQRWLFGYVFAFGSILVTAGFFLLDRNVVKPTRKLLQATQHIAAGHLDLQLEKTGPSEIYALAESFNHMAEALKNSQLETLANIQSLREANAEIQQTQHELIRSEKLATVGYIAAGMAHEIGNPLGALMGYLSLLKTDLKENPQSELLQEAANATERIDHLVKALLDYASPASTCVEALDPWVAVKDTVHMLELQGVFKSFTLKIDTNLALPLVRMDQNKLGQVLVNLLLNSIDACTGKGQITLSGMADQQQIKICVTDTGCGISPQQLNSIFEPFFTTKAPGNNRGLGLAVCQRVISEAGGEIIVESIPGQGSTFCLILPIAQKRSDSKESVAAY